MPRNMKRHKAEPTVELPPKLSEALAQVMTALPPSATSEPEYACAVCEDYGWEHHEEGGLRYASRCTHCTYWSDRRQQRVQQFFGRSEVPVRLAHYHFGVLDTPLEVTARVEAWSHMETFKHSILLYGPFGVGKTALAICAMRRLLEVFYSDPSTMWLDKHQNFITTPSLFITTPNLLDRIRATYGRNRDVEEADLLEAVKGAAILVLDDLGAERPTEWVQEKFFTIINHRYDNELTTIFTSNLTPEELAGHLGERTAWRIMEMAECVRVDGPNLRSRPSTTPSRPPAARPMDGG